jgi:ABC-2 type transport system permease protein
VSQFAIFVLVFFGGQAVAGPALTNSLDGIIVGFFLWTLTTRAFQSLSSTVMDEAKWETLERLFMSPYRFRTVMAVQALVNLSLSVLWGGMMLLLMMLATGRWLHVEPVTIASLLFLTLAPIVGVGFLMGGLAILYKRIENLFGIVTLGFLGLIAIPADKFELLKLLPLVQGSHLTRIAMEQGTQLWELPVSELFFLILPSVLYLFIGLYGFHRTQYRARKEGILGQY